MLYVEHLLFYGIWHPSVYLPTAYFFWFSPLLMQLCSSSVLPYSLSETWQGAHNLSGYIILLQLYYCVQYVQVYVWRAIELLGCQTEVTSCRSNSQSSCGQQVHHCCGARSLCARLYVGLHLLSVWRPWCLRSRHNALQCPWGWVTREEVATRILCQSTLDMYRHFNSISQCPWYKGRVCDSNRMSVSVFIVIARFKVSLRLGLSVERWLTLFDIAGANVSCFW